ncbi:MAG: glycosyl transferase family 2 [Desulfuromonas sp.]|nr:MAG: glycosyl transferase family 2 [Desulfuromonas sp.]
MSLLAHFKTAITHPLQAGLKLRTAWTLCRGTGLRSFVRTILHNPRRDYDRWVQSYDTLTDKDREQIRRHIGTFSQRPLISVIVPTYNTPAPFLRRMIDSVRDQLYSHWELCLADDGSSQPQVMQILHEYASLDERIKICRRETRGHITAASNTALGMARGDYIALLDHDDELAEHALYMMAEAVLRNPDLAFLYSDEDKLDRTGRRYDPHFKSDWNPDLFLHQNMIGHLAVFRADVIRAVGGFRKGVEGSQDYDLVARVVDHIKEEQIGHIPHILYHWCVLEGSTAASVENKPYALDAQIRTIEEHLQRNGIAGADVRRAEGLPFLRVQFSLPDPPPLVTLVIQADDEADRLRQRLRNIMDLTDYPTLEFVVVDHGGQPLSASDLVDGLEKHPPVSVLRVESIMGLPECCNRAVAQARGDIVGFLGRGIRVVRQDWLREMVSHAVRPGVGAVGARLLSPNGTVQHTGMVLGLNGVAGYVNRGLVANSPGYFGRAVLTQNWSAVSGACMLLRRQVFEAVGGFPPEDATAVLPNVDFCLKVGEMGLKVVYAAQAVLNYVPPAVSRQEEEPLTLPEKWGNLLSGDPCHNPNLSLRGDGFALAFPPRTSPPWREA